MLTTNYVLEVSYRQVNNLELFSTKLFDYVNNYTKTFGECNALFTMEHLHLEYDRLYLKFKLPTAFMELFKYRINKYLENNKIALFKVKAVQTVEHGVYLNKGKLLILRNLKRSHTLRRLKDLKALMVLNTSAILGTNYLQLSDVIITGESCEVTRVYSILRYRLKDIFDVGIWDAISNSDPLKVNVVGICNNRPINLLTLKYLDEYQYYDTLIEQSLLYDLKIEAVRGDLIAYDNLSEFELLSINLLKASPSLDAHYTKFKWK